MVKHDFLLDGILLLLVHRDNPSTWFIHSRATWKGHLVVVVGVIWARSWEHLYSIALCTYVSLLSLEWFAMSNLGLVLLCLRQATAYCCRLGNDRHLVIYELVLLVREEKRFFRELWWNGWQSPSTNFCVCQVMRRKKFQIWLLLLEHELYMVLRCWLNWLLSWLGYLSLRR